jgi:hypothetical protein
VQPLIAGTVGWNLIVIVLGLFLLGVGFRSYRFGQVVRDTPTSKPGSVAAGRVEVQGTAQPAGDPVIAPFTGEECVCLDWIIKKRDGEEWVERATGTQIEPFYLEGERGRVLVRADKHPDIDSLPWEYDSLQFVDHEQLEEVLRAFDSDDPENPATTVNPAMTENPATTTDPTVDDTAPEEEYQFVKRLLPPGTDLYIFGSAELQHDRGELGIEADETTDQFVLSRSTELWVSEFAYWVGLTALGAGILFVLWGSALVTGALGGAGF